MKPALDVKGRRFGKLVAVSETRLSKKKAWYCECDCGGNITLQTFELTSGGRKQCASLSHRRSFSVGDRFGKLVVTKMPEGLTKEEKVETICDCGNVHKLYARRLTSGSAKSCGCTTNRGGLRQPAQLSLRNALVGSYKSNAKSKDVPFDLTVEQCEALFKGDCCFCGIPPSREYHRGSYEETYTYSSIDRIDSSKGYVIDNVDSCCTSCNYLKGNKTNDEFLNHIMRIANHQTKIVEDRKENK